MWSRLQLLSLLSPDENMPADGKTSRTRARDERRTYLIRVLSHWAFWAPLGFAALPVDYFIRVPLGLATSFTVAVSVAVAGKKLPAPSPRAVMAAYWVSLGIFLAQTHW